MDRRIFVQQLTGAILAAADLARAQPPVTPVIGFLGSPSSAEWTPFVVAFRKGLNETGYIEGRNVTIAFRWADGRYDRLPALAADLVQHNVSLIVAVGGAPSALAAKAATSSIPIIFTTGGDPVAQGLVPDLARPSANVTGVSFFTSELLLSKRLQLLHELLPTATEIALFVNPTSPTVDSVVSEAQEQATPLGQHLLVLRASTEQEIEKAFAAFTRSRPAALVIAADPILNAKRETFVALAAHYAVPAVYEGRESVEAGGLMSYGPSLFDAYHQVGIYAGRILNGAKAADLPVVRATRFELVINMRTAKALGLTIPQSLLLRADEVI